MRDNLMGSILMLMFLFSVSAVCSPRARAALAQNGVVSIAFDDGNQNQYDNAYPRLKARGMPATFYEVTDWIGTSGHMTVSELQTLQNSGCEIASHSKTHADFLYLSDSQIQAECSASKQALQSWGFAASDFAYPGGDHNSHVDSIVAQYYLSARTANEGPYIVSLPASTFLVQGYPAENGADTYSDTIYYVDQAAATKGWTILFFHNIVPSSSGPYQATIEDFSKILDYIKTEGVTVMTVDQVLSGSSPPSPPDALLYWNQTTVSDFNTGNMNNVTVQSPGDVVLAQTSGGSGASVIFRDDFNNGILDSGWTVDTPNTAQWVTIDLGSIYSLATVKVYQSNFPNYFTKDYQIQVSVDNATYTTVENNTLLNSINDLETNILTATPARYVRILILSYYTAGISQGLNEVEVFQAGDPNTNIVLNKPVTASSQWPSSNYAPNKVVDGLKGTTANSSPYPWLCADGAKADAGIVVAETNGSLVITAPNNDYAHIERTLGLTSDVQNLAVTARIDVQGYAGISWRPQIALYWASGDWCGIGISNYNFITSANVYTSHTEGLVSYGGAAQNAFYYVKIVLNSTSIEFSESGDGASWISLRTVLRPSSYGGQPTLLIVGKGYGNGGFSQSGYTYPNADLDNSFPSGGDFATSYIDEVVVIASGTPTYTSSGLFTSSVWDTSFASTWKNIYWTATLPQGASIALQTRTGNASTPDASWSNWSSAYMNSGQSITSPNGRYIQYRALLVTTDATVTPVLRDVTITYVKT